VIDLARSGILNLTNDPRRASEMRSFIMACIAAALIAAIGAIILNFVQEPVDVAFTTESARI
jgi:hypothetical protein